MSLDTVSFLMWLPWLSSSHVFGFPTPSSFKIWSPPFGCCSCQTQSLQNCQTWSSSTLLENDGWRMVGKTGENIYIPEISRIDTKNGHIWKKDTFSKASFVVSMLVFRGVGLLIARLWRFWTNRMKPQRWTGCPHIAQGEVAQRYLPQNAGSKHQWSMDMIFF